MSTSSRPPAGASNASGTAARRAKQAEQARQAKRSPAGSGAPGGASGPGASAGRDESSAPDAGAAPASSGPTRRVVDPDRLVALEEERDFLLASLDDLEREHDAGDVDDHDYEELKDDYTARAAQVLRAIDDREVVLTQARAAAPRRKGRGWLIAGVVALLAVVAGVAVAQASGRRLPGETLSGDTRQSSRQQLLQAQQLFGQGKLLDAIKVYDQVLAEQPANTEALTYKGWLLVLTARSAGDPADQQVLLARAEQLLDQAVAADPSYPDARVFRAILRKQLDRPQDALSDLDTLKEGDIPPFMTDMVAGLRTELGTTAGSTPGTTRAP